MKLSILPIILIITLFFGCKSAPIPVIEEEEPPESNELTEDEIAIINKTIDQVISIITRELKNSKDDMQILIYDEFYIHRAKSADSYEADLANSEKYLRDMSFDNEILQSFVKRNIKKRTIDRNVEFNANFFWIGGKPKKNYFKLLFSNIGFNKSNEKALIHVYVDLPGWVFTEFVYLEKTDDNWKYVSSRLY